jgi:uncharacterized protein with HEPN domain
MLDMARTAIRIGENPDWSADDISVLAITRALEIIGEAAGAVTSETRDLLPLPWKNLRNMRNRIVHAYFNINLEVVSKTVQEELPALIEAIELHLSGVTKKPVD